MADDYYDPSLHEEALKRNKEITQQKREQARKQEEINKKLREQTEQYKLHDDAMKQAIADSDKYKNKIDAEIGVRQRAVSLARQMNDLIQDEAIMAETLLKNQRNIRKTKEITAKLGEIEGKQLQLRLQADLAREAGQKDVEESLLNQILLGDKTKEKLKEEQGLRNKMNDDIGLFDNVLRGIQDIPFFGDLGIASEMEDALESAASRAAVEKTSLGTMGKMKAIGPVIGKAFKSAIGPAFWIYLINKLMDVDKEIVEMSKGLNMSKGEAVGLRNELSSAATQSGDIFVTTSKMIAAQENLNEHLGTAAVFSGDILVKATQLLEKVKLTAEATAGLAGQSIVAGGAFKDNYENALATSYAIQSSTGISVDLRKVMEQVGTTTGSLRAQLNGSTEAIAEAVTNAEVLGMNLQTAADAGRTLLDFESSIEKELEAELLTGKQLNLERARAAALAGDQVTLQNELAANMGNFSDFTKMNVLQQESLAAAMGMSSDTLSDILFKQEVQGKTARELRDLGKDELAARLEATTAQDKFSAAMQKLQSIVADIVTPLIPLLDAVGGIVSLIGPVLGVLTPIIQALMTIVTAVIDSVKWLFNIDKSFDSTKQQWGTYEQSFSAWGMEPDSKKVDDFKLETNPEDTIMIDNKNNVVAGGTNLGGNKLSKEDLQVISSNNLSKEDLVDALRTVEKEKPKQNLIIREKDSNYADANPINNQGNNYQVKYETSFS